MKNERYHTRRFLQLMKNVDKALGAYIRWAKKHPIMKHESTNRKSKTAHRGALVVCCLAALSLAGCVTKTKQVIAKQTLFGFQIKAPGGMSGTGIVDLQLGLVRSEYISNPVTTNAYAAPITSHVTAKVSAIKQDVAEDITLGGQNAPPQTITKP